MIVVVVDTVSLSSLCGDANYPADKDIIIWIFSAHIQSVYGLVVNSCGLFCSLSFSSSKKVSKCSKQYFVLGIHGSIRFYGVVRRSSTTKFINQTSLKVIFNWSA